MIFVTKKIRQPAGWTTVDAACKEKKWTDSWSFSAMLKCGSRSGSSFVCTSWHIAVSTVRRHRRPYILPWTSVERPTSNVAAISLRSSKSHPRNDQPWQQSIFQSPLHWLGTVCTLSVRTQLSCTGQNSCALGLKHDLSDDGRPI